MLRFMTRRWLALPAIIAIAWVCAAVSIGISGMRMPYAKADMAVVFGNALNRNATPSRLLAARLDAALQCYRDGNCPLFFVSGSIDGPGHDEARAMQQYLMAHGVDERRIIMDNHGDNTLASARNAVAYMRAHGLASVMLVSQYHHLPRARLAFEYAGAAHVYATYPHSFMLMDFYSNWREVPAYAVYAVRLALNPDAPPVTLRPVLFLWHLLA